MTADSLDRPLRAMALGRIGLGVGALIAPRAMTRAFGIRPSPELDYMNRIYGGRAIALGLAYLLADPAERTRLQRLSLGVDVSDTVTGFGHVARRDLPLATAAAMITLTGSYAAIGLARWVSDLRG